MFVFHFGKSLAVFGFLCSPSSSFVRVHRNEQGNLVFTMTGVENTHLTLAIVLFQVGVRNFLNFLRLQTYKKFLLSFGFCKIYSFLKFF